MAVTLNSCFAGIQYDRPNLYSSISGKYKYVMFMNGVCRFVYLHGNSYVL